MPKHLRVGRRVELRRGYSSSDSLWGHIAEVQEADTLARLFHRVRFSEIVPFAATLAEAIELARATLGDAEAPVIAFRVDLEKFDTRRAS